MDIVERITKFLDERSKVRGLDQEQIACLHTGDEREAALLTSDLRRLLDIIEHKYGTDDCDGCSDRDDEIARLRDENEALASNLRGKHATTGATYAHLIAERDSLRDENARLWGEINACAATLPGSIYMDPPDGGSVTVAEQLARMGVDAARYRWLRNVEPEVPKAVLDMVAYGLDDLDDAIDAAMQKGE